MNLKTVNLKKNNLKTMLSITLIAGIFSPVLQAKEQIREHYKCYLLLQDRSEIIQNFISEETGIEKFQKTVEGSFIFLSDGVTKMPIEKVYECQPQGEQFINGTARIIESKTPF